MNSSFFSKHSHTIIQWISWIGILATILIGVYLYQTGLLTNRDALQQTVQQAGPLGIVLFVFIQVVQVIIPIIPGGVSLAAGVVLFGPFYGFVWNYIGIVGGSTIAFLLARKIGRPLLHTFFKKDQIEKYDRWTTNNNRFTLLFAFAIFFPIAPDDFLCYLAGTTPMKLKTFLLIILLGKPASIALYSLGLTTLFSFLPLS